MNVHNAHSEVGAVRPTGGPTDRPTDRQTSKELFQDSEHPSKKTDRSCTSFSDANLAGDFQPASSSQSKTIVQLGEYLQAAEPTSDHNLAIFPAAAAHIDLYSPQTSSAPRRQILLGAQSQLASLLHWLSKIMTRWVAACCEILKSNLEARDPNLCRSWIAHFPQTVTVHRCEPPAEFSRKRIFEKTSWWHGTLVLLNFARTKTFCQGSDLSQSTTSYVIVQIRPSAPNTS